MKKTIFLCHEFLLNNGRIFSQILSVGALVLVITVSALADFSYSDFNSANGLNLVGNASVYSDRLRVTSASSYQAGAAWYTAKQSVESGFSTTFQFQITNASGGDGFAFVIQNHSLTAMGALGGLLGYGGDPELYSHLGEGIPNSIVLSQASIDG